MVPSHVVLNLSIQHQLLTYVFILFDGNQSNRSFVLKSVVCLHVKKGRLLAIHFGDFIALGLCFI